MIVDIRGQTAASEPSRDCAPEPIRSPRSGATTVAFLTLAFAASACGGGLPALSTPRSGALQAGASQAGSTPPSDAETLFLRHCATCHLGGGGLLGSPRTPDLFTDPLPRGDSAEAILHAMRFGIDAPRMPAFEAGLAPEEMQRIARYVRERRGLVEADARPAAPSRPSAPATTREDD